MKREVLRAERIRTDYRQMICLKDFSLTLYEGKITGLTGMTGSGLTVVADVLAGKRKLINGRLYLDGKQFLPSEKNNGSKLFVVTGKSVFLHTMRLGENICLGRKGAYVFGPVFEKNRKQEIGKLMKELGVSLDLDAYPEKQDAFALLQAEILRVCYFEASVLILDNISVMCRDDEYARLLLLLSRVKDRGIAVLMLDMDKEKLYMAADELAVLRDGRVEGILKPEGYRTEIIEKIAAGDWEKPPMHRAVPLQDLETAVILKSWGDGWNFEIGGGEVAGFWEEKEGIPRRLLRFLWGEDPRNAGRLALMGRTVNLKGGHKALVQQGVGYIEGGMAGMFPERSLSENLTIASVGRMGRGLALNGSLEKAVVKDAFNTLGIEPEEWHRMLKETGGRTQMLVAVYRWILAQSKVLIFSDVLKGADLMAREGLKEALALGIQNNIAMLLFSSNRKEMYELCSHIYILRDGEITEEWYRNC